MVRSVALRRLLVAAGVVAVALGVVGAFLPLIPTTPFLLLAAACFIRSSERHYRWLVEHPRLGPHVRNYMEHRATTMRVKVVTLALLWVSIGYAALVVVESWVPRAVLLGVAVGVTAHVLRLKVIR